MIERGIPLPLKWVENRRSMLYVLNLADAIKMCLEAPQARNQTYLVSDGEDITTPHMIETLASMIKRPARLWPVPVAWLRGVGRIMGKAAMIDRLTGSLAVDSSKFRNQLQWSPPYTLDAGLRATMEWYRDVRGRQG